MKKYSKPKIEFEIFSVSENVATGCGSDGGWIVRGMLKPEDCYAESDMFPEVHPYLEHGMCDFKATQEYCNMTFAEEYQMFNSY